MCRFFWSNESYKKGGKASSLWSPYLGNMVDRVESVRVNGTHCQHSRSLQRRRAKRRQIWSTMRYHGIHISQWARWGSPVSLWKNICFFHQVNLAVSFSLTIIHTPQKFHEARSPWHIKLRGCICFWIQRCYSTSAGRQCSNRIYLIHSRGSRSDAELGAVLAYFAPM